MNCTEFVPDLESQQLESSCSIPSLYDIPDIPAVDNGVHATSIVSEMRSLIDTTEAFADASLDDACAGSDVDMADMTCLTDLPCDLFVEFFSTHFTTDELHKYVRPVCRQFREWADDAHQIVLPVAHNSWDKVQRAVESVAKVNGLRPITTVELLAELPADADAIDKLCALFPRLKMVHLNLSNKSPSAVSDLVAVMQRYFDQHGTIFNLDWEVTQAAVDVVNVYHDLIVQPFCRLQNINLSCIDLTTQGCQMLGASLRRLGYRERMGGVSALRKVNLSMCGLSEELLDPIITNWCASIRVLDLSHNELGDAGIQTLCSALSRGQGTSYNLRNLETFSVKRSHIGVAGAKAIASTFMRPGSRMTTLDISANNLGDEGFACIAAALSSSSILSLSAASCKLQESSCEVLARAYTDVAAAGQCIRLTKLDLGSNSFKSVKSVAALRTVLSSTASRIETLNVSMCSIGQAEAAVFVEAFGDTSCRVMDLDISNNNIADAGFKALMHALARRSQGTLKSLHVNFNKITSDSMRSLADFVVSPASSLKALGMRLNDVDETGGVILGEALSSTTCSITSLNLSSNSMKLAGCTSICEGAIAGGSEANLQSLDITNNDVPFQALATLKDSAVPSSTVGVTIAV
eukprot:GFYU01001211.1.p1 GENE.GFYU01001211.1~~GFYU01001211.1.p1  ORF type:complete len:636 (+),score=153.04 GFYU01001211.1:166-2073(+)